MVAVAFPTPDIEEGAEMSTTIVGVAPKNVIGSRVVVNLKVPEAPPEIAHKVSGRRSQHLNGNSRGRGIGGWARSNNYEPVRSSYSELTIAHPVTCFLT